MKKSISKKKKSRRWKYHALLLKKKRHFDGKDYYILPKSLKLTQNKAIRKAEKIRSKGGCARVIKGTFEGNPSFRIYSRTESSQLIKRKKKRWLR